MICGRSGGECMTGMDVIGVGGGGRGVTRVWDVVSVGSGGRNTNMGCCMDG